MYVATVARFACRILSAKMASGGGSPPSSSRWWSDLSDECPIPLEPLSTLPYPPFRLLGGGISRHGGGGDSSNANAMYFDGLALASYCVSRATFTNPLTREALTWEDCVRLDDYLEEHCYHDQLRHQRRNCRLGAPPVVHRSGQSRWSLGRPVSTQLPELPEPR